MKKLKFISVILCIMIFTSTSVCAENNAISKPIDKPSEFAVFVAKDGLYILNLKENNSSIIDKGEKIKEPLISRDGYRVAYTKNDDLYICNIKTNEIENVAKSIESYDWDSTGDLAYSTQDTGMSLYNIDTKKSAKIISNEYYYYNIKWDSNNKIYANKRPKYSEKVTVKWKEVGIISYDLIEKTEKLILKGIASTDTEIGSTPNVAQISKDDKYIYIWNKVNSASMSADATEFSAFDVINNKFIQVNNEGKKLDLENPNRIIALAYKDNISPNPVNSSIVAIIKGDGRDMFINKTLGILNIQTQVFTKILLENQVAMTPSYSEDGKNILYSASKSLTYEAENNGAPIYKMWQNQPHYIYEINVKTQKITQITHSEYFDFMPRYLLNDEILFVRAQRELFSLWKIKNGKETKIAESLNFNSDYSNSWYYGHYETEKVIDLFISGK